VQPREPALCQLYRRTFVPYAVVVVEIADDACCECWLEDLDAETEERAADGVVDDKTSQLTFCDFL